MKASTKTLGSIAGLFIFFSLGLYICIFANRAIVDMPMIELASTNIARDPAAIRRTYDFSMLEGSALEAAAKNRLLSGLSIVEREKQVGVELGHFVIKGENGEKTFACQRFTKIAMNFEGDGMAVSGELPRMEVEGLCEMSADINSISPLMIPYSKIVGEPVGDGEFNFQEGKAISIRFSNVVDQWPKSWRLSGVRIFDEANNKDQVIISADDMKVHFSKPFILNFSQQ